MATNVNSHRETSPVSRSISDRFSSIFLQEAKNTGPIEISALQVQSISSTKQNSGSKKSKMAANGYSHREPSFTNSTVSDGFSSNFVQENEDTVCKKVPICTDEPSVDPPTPAAQPSSTEALEMEVSPNPVALDQISSHDVHTGSSGGLHTS
uniref:Uncharacterized protein n=1 Tax=Xenopus tropicalis TaxID=8364 RepID=A0A1B8XVA7_XENTR